MAYRRLWVALGTVVALSFLVLGFVGYKGIKGKPPIPGRVVTTAGEVVFDGATIRDGQNVWQSIGGQEIGSIFGHGAYVAPDWTADYLHREATLVLGRHGYDAASGDGRAALRARLQAEMRRNTYDPKSDTLTVSPERAAAFAQLKAYYASVFRDGRKEYAIPRGALTDPKKLDQMTAFFFWTSWVATTERPGTNVTYTQNWPHEELVGNRPTTSAILWSLASVVLLLAGVGGMVWYFGSKKAEAAHAATPENDPLLAWSPTPSQRATVKYFLVVAALFLLQITVGVVTAHYGVEGNGLFGIPLDRVLPYSIARTWHLQIGIFWIATAWLATGLFLAPAIGGAEPKGQRLGVNVLFGALVFVVFGSLAGEWLGIQQKLGNLWFWFGSQGYEYVDLGRVWQALLFGGLCFWLWLLARAVMPALKRKGEDRSLLVLFVSSAVAIPAFYSAGLMYGQRSHLVTAEYWRWWVVHLWVEGFFEVFATAVIAFLFTRLGVLTLRTATKATLFSTIVFLAGGIVGTFHHLYFTGMPVPALALGAVFSALELVPLCLVGFEAWEHIRLARGETAKWLTAYKWPIYFFVAVAFWNLVGAGLFGFLINPPVALYFMQGLNLTPVHGHTALFGVYGMLAIGLMLFSLRAWKPGRAWKDAPVKFAFWAINLGLALMCFLSVLPIGILQTIAAIEHGTWYARSAEFLQSPLLQNIRWTRALGDSLFAAGAVVLAWFVLGLVTGRSYDDGVAVTEPREAWIAPADEAVS